MKARLKDSLMVGNGHMFSVPNRNVEIIDQEDHSIYGRRYKLQGHDEWFEKSSFEYIDSITFEDFIRYGIGNGGNIVNGIPWSFKYKGYPVTNENEKCYIVLNHEGMLFFTPEDILITDANDKLYIRKKTDY